MAKKKKDYTAKELQDRKSFLLKGMLIIFIFSLLVGGGVALVVLLIN